MITSDPAAVYERCVAAGAEILMDPGWVLTWLTLSTFMSRIDRDRVSTAMGDLLDRSPRVAVQMPDGQSAD